MRLLHTSDWHIGVSHHRLDRTADHDKVFAQIKNLAIEEKVDVILNTGDLFDAPYPSVETLKYGWSVLEDLALVAPVVVVCGNHDGPKLFQLMGMILKNRLPIHLVDASTLQQLRDKSILQLPAAAGETLKIGVVPFVKSSSYIARYIDDDPERATVAYVDEVGTLEHRVGEWLNVAYDPNHDIRIFAAHLLVEGAQISGSEYELYRESDFVTDPARIPSADYVAFGHIHKPQQIAGMTHGRYAGSPIPIDFGERDDKKVCYLVSGEPGRALKIEERQLDVGRRLVDISGTLSTIGAQRDLYAGTVARVIVDLEFPVPQLESQVRDLLPDTQICKVAARFPRPEGGEVIGIESGKSEPTIAEMFAAYVREHPNLGEPDQLIRYFNELYGQVKLGDESANIFTLLDEIVP